MPAYLELRHFRLVQHIAETQSITRAAERLHISQPALSRQLRDIESKLGVALFDRHGKTMRVTVAGREVLAAAPQLLDAARRVEAAVLDIAAGTQGSIRLATECFTGYRWLPALIEGFQVVYPDVTVDVHLDATGDPLQALRTGTLDLALVYSAVDDPKLQAVPLFDDALVAVLHPSHPLATRPYVIPADFADQHLVVYDAETADVMREVLLPAGVRPRRVSSLRITDGLLNLVKANLAITVVAGWAAASDVASGRVMAVPITEHGLVRHWQAVYSATNEPPSYLTAFVEQLVCKAQEEQLLS